MSKNKWLLLVLTILPMLYIIGFIGLVFQSVIYFHNHTQSNPWIFSYFWVFFVVHILFMAEIIFTIVLYVFNILKNPNVPREERTLWVVLVILLSFAGMLIYWFLKIRGFSPQKQSGKD